MRLLTAAITASRGNLACVHIKNNYYFSRPKQQVETHNIRGDLMKHTGRITDCEGLF